MNTVSEAAVRGLLPDANDTAHGMTTRLKEGTA
jgi:hypothetical protein